MIKKTIILNICLLFILCGCNSFPTKDDYMPNLKVKWKYENNFLTFTVINLSEESIMITLPLVESGVASNGDRKISYYIQHRYHFDDNIPNFTGEVIQDISSAHFKVLIGAYPKAIMDKHSNKPYLCYGQTYIAKVPCLVKFRDIDEIQVDIQAIPLSSLSTVNDLKSFQQLWRDRNFTYIVNFLKNGYDKSEGIMELKPERTGGSTGSGSHL